MNILFVSAGPIESNGSGVLRNVALIKGLLDNGNSVDIVTSRCKKESPIYDNSLIKDIRAANIFYLNENGRVKNKKSNSVYVFIKYIIRYIYYRFAIYDRYTLLLKKVSKLKKMLKDKKYDVIISSSDPRSSHLIAKSIIKMEMLDVRWIQYWGDPMYLDVTKKTIMRSRIKRSERKLLELANKIVYVTPMTLSSQKKLYESVKSKMVYLPTAYIKPDFTNISLLNRKSKILYTGNYSSYVRNILPLYRCGRKYEMNLYIIGNSNLNLDSSETVNIVNRRLAFKEIDETIKNADILICICNIDNIFLRNKNKSSIAIPGKIYHYSAYSKPIIVAVENHNDSVIEAYRKYNRFEFCLNEEESIYRAFCKIVDGKSSCVLKPVEDFSPNLIAKRFL